MVRSSAVLRVAAQGRGESSCGVMAGVCDADA